MSSSVPLQVGETVQTAHLQRHPSPHHDLNPSTAASKREPVRQEPVTSDDVEEEDDSGEEEEEEESEEEEEESEEEEEEAEALELELEDDDEEDETETEDELLYRSRVRPSPRLHHLHHLPPMPDLRFEQSYLSSIRNADTWWKVGWITVRDQVGNPPPSRIICWHMGGGKRERDGTRRADATPGHDALRAGHRLQPGHLRLAPLEPQRADPRVERRRAHQAVVLPLQGVDDTAREEG